MTTALTRTALLLLTSALVGSGCGGGGESATDANHPGTDASVTGDSATSQDTGTVVDLEGALEIETPQGTSFGTTMVATTSPHNLGVTFRNTTSRFLHVTAALTGTHASEAAFDHALDHQDMAPGDQTWVSVKLTPTTGGDKAVTLELTVSTDNPMATRIFTVDFTGSARPFAYVGERAFSAGSAGSFLKLSDPLHPDRSGRSSDRSIALAADEGTLYIAFKDNTVLFNPANVESGRLTVMKYAGGQWSVVGSPGISEGDTMWISLVVHAGTPYVAYAESLDPAQPEEGKGTVLKWDGAAWVPVGGAARFTSNSAAYGSLFAVAGQSGPELYFSFQDGDEHREINGEDRHCAVSAMKWSGASWQFVGAPAFTYPELAGSTTSIVVANGTPYVAFSRGLMKYDAQSGEWTKMAAFQAGSTAAAVDPNGAVHVAFNDGQNASKAAVFKLDGTTWQSLGAPGISRGATNFLSLGFRGGVPHVAFSDVGDYGGVQGAAVLMTYSAGTWSAVGGGPATLGEANHTSMAIDGDNLYLGFKDEEVRAAQDMEGSGKASVIELR